MSEQPKPGMLGFCRGICLTARFSEVLRTYLVERPHPFDFSILPALASLANSRDTFDFLL